MSDDPDDEEEEGDSPRSVCVGCGIHAPKTNTNYTLISARYGWRLIRATSPEGVAVGEWRCPTCWEERKKKLGALAESGMSAVGPGSKRSGFPER